MSEIQIVVAVIITLAAAYLVIYPKYAASDVKRLAWLDVAVGAALLAVLAPFYWGKPNDFTFIAFDTNWWIFTILTYAILELPLFFLYVRARGLKQEYLDSFKLTHTGPTQLASEKSVAKQLSDTKWDGLRTRSALRALVIGANLTMVMGTLFLTFVGDSDWSALVVLYITLIFIFWYLLRTAVRLIPEAPDSALDERLIQERNSIYFTAYTYLVGVSATLAAMLMGFAIATDILEDNESFNGFNYELNLTWPQIQAIFWLVYGYAYMLPSMIMAWREYKRLTISGELR